MGAKANLSPEVPRIGLQCAVNSRFAISPTGTATFFDSPVPVPDQPRKAYPLRVGLIRVNESEAIYVLGFPLPLTEPPLSAYVMLNTSSLYDTRVKAFYFRCRLAKAAEDGAA